MHYMKKNCLFSVFLFPEALYRWRYGAVLCEAVCCSSLVYMHQVSAPKGLLSPKHLLFKSCSCRVFALCAVTRVYVLVRLLTFQLIFFFFPPPLFLLLTLSPGHRLINGYHSQLISYSSFGNYIRILTTQTKRWGGEREQSKGKIN